MKVTNVKIQQANRNQNFRGSLTDTVANTFANNSKLVAGIAGLATSSVVGQKIVMSGSEAVVGPDMDIGIGKAITKVTNEKDGRTNQSSKVQAIRTAAQSIGGTITGVAIRMGCIALATLALSKAGQKGGSAIADTLLDKGKISADNAYEFTEHMAKWGKTVGGAVAIAIMTVTNFIIDAPFINMINKKMTDIFDKKPNKEQGKEVK